MSKKGTPHRGRKTAPVWMLSLKHLHIQGKNDWKSGYPFFSRMGSELTRFLSTCRESTFLIKNFMVYSEASIKDVNNFKLINLHMQLWRSQTILWNKFKIVRAHRRKLKNILQKSNCGKVLDAIWLIIITNNTIKVCEYVSRIILLLVLSLAFKSI